MPFKVVLSLLTLQVLSFSGPTPSATQRPNVSKPLKFHLSCGDTKLGGVSRNSENGLTGIGSPGSKRNLDIQRSRSRQRYEKCFFLPGLLKDMRSIKNNKCVFPFSFFFVFYISPNGIVIEPYNGLLTKTRFSYSCNKQLKIK